MRDNTLQQSKKSFLSEENRNLWAESIVTQVCLVESLVLKGNMPLVNAKRLHKNTQVEIQREETGYHLCDPGTAAVMGVLVHCPWGFNQNQEEESSGSTTQRSCESTAPSQQNT